MPFTPPVDSRFNDKYECKERLGQGKEGAVWKAEHRYKNITVAIKIKDIVNGDVDTPLKEARVLQSLSGNDNIVQVHDVDVFENSIVIAIEYCPGGTLHDRLKGGKIAVEEALNITAQLLIALRPIHSLKLFHRDIKPHNILFDAKNNAKLSDFGIADALKTDSFSAGLSGTLPYMAPEVTSGRNLADERADFWSLGVILYEMLTGVRPFVIEGEKEAENISNWHRVTSSSKPKPLTELMKDEDEKTVQALQGIVDICFRKQTNRFKSPDRFLLYLRDNDLYHLPLNEEDFVAIDRFTSAQNYITQYIRAQLNAGGYKAYKMLLDEYKASGRSHCSDSEFAKLARFAEKRNDVYHSPQNVREKRWVPSLDALNEIEAIATKMTGKPYQMSLEEPQPKFYKTDRPFVPIIGDRAYGQGGAAAFHEADTDEQHELAVQQEKADQTPIGFLLTNKHSGKCLDVSWDENWFGVHQQDKSSYVNQQWLLYQADEGYFAIVSCFTGRCLDVDGALEEARVPVTQWHYEHQHNQQWYFERNDDDGSYFISARHSGLYLDMLDENEEDGGTPGWLGQYEYNGGDSQRWWITLAV